MKGTRSKQGTGNFFELQLLLGGVFELNAAAFLIFVRNGSLSAFRCF